MENKQTPKKKLDNQITDKDDDKANNNKISSPKDKVKNSISNNKYPQKKDIKNEQKKNDDENDFLLPVKTIKKNKLGKSVDTNKNSEINIGNYNKDRTNSINNLILLDGVKSNYILTKLTQNLSRKTILNAVKYNKQLRRRLNIELKEYQTYLQTEIELNFVQSYSNLEPINFIILDNSKASSSFLSNAPLPTLISITIFLEPAAIFLLIILTAISGIDSTVPVTSRRAYIFLSKGAKLAV